ncbi:MAG: prepilin-type N-terminal cleavage/methylation domain-containing protein [Minisyncoccota bacterium]
MNMKGFTLVEALVAVAIVALAIAGPMYSASRAIVAAEVAQQQLTASYLAQEGIEYVRSMRDDAYLYAYNYDLSSGGNATLDGWKDFLNGNPSNIPGSIKQCYKDATKNPNGVSEVCSLDPSLPMGTQNGDSLNPCVVGSNNCPLPLYLSSSNTYTTNSGSGTYPITPFTRDIEIEDVSGAATDLKNNPVEIRIKSVVTWMFHGSSYSVTVTDHLTPWQ